MAHCPTQKHADMAWGAQTPSRVLGSCCISGVPPASNWECGGAVIPLPQTAHYQLSIMLRELALPPAVAGMALNGPLLVPPLAPQLNEASCIPRSFQPHVLAASKELSGGCWYVTIFCGKCFCCKWPVNFLILLHVSLWGQAAEHWTFLHGQQHASL